MKGYSFQELVKLAEAAVKRAGDTMTGNLTVPKVLVSDAQGTEVNALTRRDYVDAELAKKLDLAGGTLTGQLSSTATFAASSSNAQISHDGKGAVNTQINIRSMREATSATWLWEKIANGNLYYSMGTNGAGTDKIRMAVSTGEIYLGNANKRVYHEGNKPTPADVGAVNKAGDTMTGTLALSSSTFGTLGVSTGAVFDGMYNNARIPHVVDAATSGSSYAPAFAARYAHNAGWSGIYSLGVLNYNAQSPGSFCVHHINRDGGQALLWQFDGTAGDFTAPGAIFTGSAQNNSGHALTRKDYVDSQVATRAPMAHTHTVSAITDLKPQDANITANTLVLRDSEACIHAQLIRTTYADESTIGGAIAFRVNNSTNNYTRYCSNPAAVREWMRYAKTGWDMYARAYIEHTGYPMTEYHIPGWAAVMTYLTSDGNYRITTSNGAGVDVKERLRLDSGGNLFSTGAIYEAGQRVYSPDNPPNYSHYHTAAQGNQDIVASGWGQVGTYMMAAVIPGHSAAMNPAATIAGSSLRPANCAEWGQNRDWTLPGTWKCLGFVSDQQDDRWDDRTTLWIRIA